MKSETKETKPVSLIYPIVMVVTVLFGCWWLLEGNNPRHQTETHEQARP